MSESSEEPNNAMQEQQDESCRKRKKSMVGATLSKFKSLKEDDFMKLVSKRTKSFNFLEDGKKKKKKEKLNAIHAHKSAPISNEEIKHIKTDRKSEPIIESNGEFLYDFIESKNEEEDSFLSESLSTSSSPSNSKEDIQNEFSEDTAASRRAKYIQRYVTSTSPDSSYDDVSIKSNTSMELEDPHATKVAGSNKKFHKRFKLSEERVIEDFLCALLLRGALLAQGSMYITQNYVCFYANIFGKKTRVMVPFREIISVRKCKILKSIPNSIEIHTVNKKYFWASFLHRENAFQLIDTRWRYIRMLHGSPVVDEVRPLEDENTEWGVDDKASDIGFDWRESAEFSFSTSFSESSDEHLTGAGAKNLLPPISPVCCHQVERNNNVVANAPTYSEKFPITIQEFYLHLLSDNSDTFWKEFHARYGYAAFSMTAWSSSLEGCCLERHADFKAPIKMSLAPKHTRVKQKQRCRFISNDEIIFETSSHSRDVPYSNQFLVDAVWHIKNLPDNSGCELKTSIFVRFTKKNWLKSMIEKNAIEGSRDWFENWIESALAVAKHIKRNSNTPTQLLRSSTKEILNSLGSQSSRNTSDDLKNERHEDSISSSASFSRRYFKYSLIILFLLVISLFCTCIYFYLQCQYIRQDIDDINGSVEVSNYLNLRKAITFVSSGMNDVDNLSSHWNSNPPVANFVNNTMLGNWASLLKQLQTIVVQKDDLSIPNDEGTPSDFYDIVSATMDQLN